MATNIGSGAPYVFFFRFVRVETSLLRAAHALSLPPPPLLLDDQFFHVWPRAPFFHKLCGAKAYAATAAAVN